MNKLKKYVKYSDGPHAFKFYFDSHAGFDVKEFVTRGKIQSKKANSEPVQNRKKSKRKNVFLVRSAD